MLIPLGAVAILGASWLFPIVFGSFATINVAQGVVLLGVIVALPTIFFFSRLLTVYSEFSVQVPIAIASVTVGAVSSVPMILSWGLTGALCGFLSAMLVRSLLLIRVTWHAAHK